MQRRFKDPLKPMLRLQIKDTNVPNSRIIISVPPDTTVGALLQQVSAQLVASSSAMSSSAEATFNWDVIVGVPPNVKNLIALPSSTLLADVPVLSGDSLKVQYLPNVTAHQKRSRVEASNGIKAGVGIGSSQKRIRHKWGKSSGNVGVVEGEEDKSMNEESINEEGVQESGEAHKPDRKRRPRITAGNETDISEHLLQGVSSGANTARDKMIRKVFKSAVQHQYDSSQAVSRVAAWDANVYVHESAELDTLLPNTVESSSKTLVQASSSSQHLMTKAVFKYPDHLTAGQGGRLEKHRQALDTWYSDEVDILAWPVLRAVLLQVVDAEDEAAGRSALEIVNLARLSPRVFWSIVHFAECNGNNALVDQSRSVLDRRTFFLHALQRLLPPSLYPAGQDWAWWGVRIRSKSEKALNAAAQQTRSVSTVMPRGNEEVSEPSSAFTSCDEPMAKQENSTRPEVQPQAASGEALANRQYMETKLTSWLYQVAYNILVPYLQEGTGSAAEGLRATDPSPDQQPLQTFRRHIQRAFFEYRKQHGINLTNTFAISNEKAAVGSIGSFALWLATIEEEDSMDETAHDRHASAPATARDVLRYLGVAVVDIEAIQLEIQNVLYWAVWKVLVGSSARIDRLLRSARLTSVHRIANFEYYPEQLLQLLVDCSESGEKNDKNTLLPSAINPAPWPLEVWCCARPDDGSQDEEAIAENCGNCVPILQQTATKETDYVTPGLTLDLCRHMGQLAGAFLHLCDWANHYEPDDERFEQNSVDNVNDQLDKGKDCLVLFQEKEDSVFAALLRAHPLAHTAMQMSRVPLSQRTDTVGSSRSTTVRLQLIPSAIQATAMHAAANLFREVAIDCDKAYGEHSLLSALAWYLHGTALLRLEQDWHSLLLTALTGENGSNYSAAASLSAHATDSMSAPGIRSGGPTALPSDDQVRRVAHALSHEKEMFQRHDRALEAAVEAFSIAQFGLEQLLARSSQHMIRLLCLHFLTRTKGYLSDVSRLQGAEPMDVTAVAAQEALNYAQQGTQIFEHLLDNAVCTLPPIVYCFESAEHWIRLQAEAHYALAEAHRDALKYTKFEVHRHATIALTHLQHARALLQALLDVAASRGVTEDFSQQTAGVQSLSTERLAANKDLQDIDSLIDQVSHTLQLEVMEASPSSLTSSTPSPCPSATTLLNRAALLFPTPPTLDTTPKRKQDEIICVSNPTQHVRPQNPFRTPVACLAPLNPSELPTAALLSAGNDQYIENHSEQRCSTISSTLPVAESMPWIFDPTHCPYYHRTVRIACPDEQGGLWEQGIVVGYLPEAKASLQSIPIAIRLDNRHQDIEPELWKVQIYSTAVVTTEVGCVLHYPQQNPVWDFCDLEKEELLKALL